MTPQENVKCDVNAVKHFRNELRKGRPVVVRAFDITATPNQLADEQERLEYVARQNSITGSLVTYEPLYRDRVELSRPGDGFRLYFSPVGHEFEPVIGNEPDDALVSWAHPRFLAIRDLECGANASLGNFSWKVTSRTELGREHLGVLYDLLVKGIDFPDTLYSQVSLDGEIQTSARPELLEKSLDLLTEEALDESEQFAEPKEKPRLVLDTVVKRQDGKSIEIPFALDRKQWDVISKNASSGTIVLTGPPGTGKTTIALLRATTLIHSIYEHDERGKRLSDVPTADLKKDRFRVFVVTEHLRHYLKDFLSSAELGLPEAQVVNLRGAFLEQFVRHKTLTTWINGLRFRLSKQKNKLSGTLLYIKSLAQTLRLCFYHAVLNAEEHSGPDCKAIIDRIYDRIYAELERTALERVLSEAEYKLWKKELESPVPDLDAFLISQRKVEAFHDLFDPRNNVVRTQLSELRSFLQEWLSKAKARVLDSIDAPHETWLLPGGDDLLLSRFVDEIQLVEGQSSSNLFVREAWRELVHLVDPKEVLLRVVAEFAETADVKPLHEAGLSRDEVIASLREWRETLSGDLGENEEDEEGEIVEYNAGEEEPELQRRRGAFTRSDFPILGALARVFLALPPEAKEHPERYRRVGFLLPDDVARYDHIIVDEGQDFTYTELHLVQSLVENKRGAVTISGDPQQRMDWHSGLSSIESVFVSGDRRHRVGRNYRQTIELNDWVARLNSALFGEPSHPTDAAFDHGPPPTIAIFNNMSEMRKSAATSFGDWYLGDRNPFSALLQIGFDAGMKRRITDTLATALEDRSVHVERIEDGRMIERGRVYVADVPTVKGLEFDGVVVMVSKEACELLEMDTPDAIVTRNMLYVACSRAKRNLSVVLQADVRILARSGIY